MINVFGVGHLGSETLLPLAGAQALPLLQPITYLCGCLRVSVCVRFKKFTHNLFSNILPVVLIKMQKSDHYYFMLVFFMCS